MMKKIISAAMVAFAILAPASALQAQARTCLVTAQSPPAVAEYDPFNPAALNVTNVVMNFTRANSAGGAKPQVFDFYVTSSDPELNGTQLIPRSAVGAGQPTGLNQDIYYGTNETEPNIMIPLPQQPIPGVLRWEFSGNNTASDTFQVSFDIILPPNLELTTSTLFSFDVEYGCDGTGGGPPFSDKGISPDAFVIDITVLSALQASYVGPALDFGEVGDVADADPPKTAAGNIRVNSSDVYTVSMVSENNYRLGYPGGNLALADQSLDYSVTFLGLTRSPANTSAITAECIRAGVNTGVLMPVSVQLLEGGDDEVPSPDYIDYLIVTFSPQIDLPAAGACGA